MMYQLFPIPKHFTFGTETLPLTACPQISISPCLKKSCREHGYDPCSALSQLFTDSSGLSVTVHADYISCGPEAFCLDISAKGIWITCSGGAGLFYGIQALKQLAAQGDHSIPYANVKDEPSLPIRGIMLDIGRDKIPSMNTLRTLFDQFSAMRINHVQMYMEGFCFQYKEYQYLFAGETPLTPEEFEELCDYAKAGFIDLVPNQNVLGHMEKWLEKPQFNHLAECEEGYLFENLFWRPPMTLDVRDPGSIHLAETLLDTLIQHSKSDYINVNMDEPFELGAGKNKENAAQSGRLSLYFEYLEKLYAYCRKNGKKMMMWGDEILHNPQCVAQFPKDVMLLDWIYEGDADFTSHAKLMQQTGLSFCLCPGTSSWGSLTGRSDNMKKNVENAVRAALEYGGTGIITTDWGDLGHWQYLSASYPGYAWTAACSWSGPQSASDIVSWYCSRFIYQTPDSSMYDAAWDLGNYYHLEHAPLYNTTLAFAVMSSKYPFNTVEEFDSMMERLLRLSANIAKTNGITPKETAISIDYSAIGQWLEQTESKIDTAFIYNSDSLLIRDEMKNGLRMVRHGIHLYYVMKELRNDTELFEREMKDLYQELDSLMKEHYRLWMARNRAGGFERSTRHLVHLLSFYRKMTKTISGNLQ